MNKPKSPEILEYSWGKIRIAGFEKPFKDVILFPGGAEEWDWNKTGTEHYGGIQPKEISLLLDKGADVLVISKGMLNRLRLSKKAREMLEFYHVEYYHLNTKQAVEKYNELAGSRFPGALIHTTC